MGAKSIAADTCRRLAMHYQGLVEAADILDSAEVSESYLTGLKKEIETTKVEVDKAKKVLATTQDDLKKVQASGLDELRQTDIEVTRRLAAGKAELDRQMGLAKEQAGQAIEAATKEKATVLQRLQAQIESATATLTDLQTRTREAALQERAATDKANAASDALASLQGKVNKMVQNLTTLGG